MASLLLIIPFFLFENSDWKSQAAQDQMSITRSVFVVDMNTQHSHRIDVREEWDRDRATLLLSRKAKNIDSMSIEDVRGVQEIKVICEKFLAVEFSIRGGTGTGSSELAIFAVRGGRIFKCLHIENESSSVFDTVFDSRADSLQLFDERSLYRLTLQANCAAKGFPTLSVRESSYVSSKMNPSENRNTSTDFTLIFDKKRMIFFNDSTFLNGHYRLSQRNKFYTLSDTSFSNQKVRGILFQDTQYYYLGKTWFSQGRDNILIRQ